MATSAGRRGWYVQAASTDAASAQEGQMYPDIGNGKLYKGFSLRTKLFPKKLKSRNWGPRPPPSRSRFIMRVVRACVHAFTCARPYTAMNLHIH